MTRRRYLLGLAAASAWGAAGAAFAQASAATARHATTPLSVAQIVDVSAAQQDVGRDFLAGSRLAWQAINARGGIQGQPIRHWVIEVDGTPSGVQRAWNEAHAQRDCIALSGCVGHAAAAALARYKATHAPGGPLAQAAPWLHTSVANAQSDDVVFPVFADYEAQASSALANLASVGVQELGVVFATPQAEEGTRAMIESAARAAEMRMHVLPMRAAAKAAPASTPTQAIVLFIGGTPELHAYARSLALPAGRQCYLVGLSDVNLQVLAQLGGAPRNVSVIATQVVPPLNAGLPIARDYRTALAQLYDEAPTPQGLAGFIAARYTAEVLAQASGPLTRASALAAFRRRTSLNLDGFAVNTAHTRRAPITQTMLTAAGRIVG